jgi:tetratricopeptide (TPR) repeat protein
MKTTLNTARILVASVCLMILFGHALSTRAYAQSAQSDLIAQKQALFKAVSRNETAKFAELQKAFDNLFASQKQPLAAYYAAYTLQRMAITSKGDGKETLLLDACKRLEDCLSAQGLTPAIIHEAQALLASCYGQLAGTGMMNGMKYGGKSSTLMDETLRAAPNNPRALLMSATSLYFKPAMFGGDKKKAVEQWQRAAQIFDQEAEAKKSPNPVVEPDWGHDEVYAWLGQSFVDEGNADAAKASYERALEINPEYSWVKYVLMPKLAKK